MSDIYDITLECLCSLFPRSTFEIYNQYGEYIDTFNDIDKISESKYSDSIAIYGHAKDFGVMYVEIYIEED